MTSLLRPLNDPAYATKSAAYTGTAGTTGDFPGGPQGVEIFCTSDAYVRVGPNATATSADAICPANTAIAFHVPWQTGGVWRVSAIQVSAAGTVYAKPLNIE